MAEVRRKYISVSVDELARATDVAQLILRLPYTAACEVADHIGADVNAMIEGAEAILRTNPEADDGEK